MAAGRVVAPKLTAAFVSVAAFIGAFVTPVAPRAQSLAVLTGKVTDKNGEPIPGVQVFVVAGGSERSAVTGPDGRYQMLSLPAGTYSARAVVTGFKVAVESDVVVNPAAPRQLDFTLQVGCLAIVDYADPGLAWAIREATAVLQIRIRKSGAGEYCPAAVSSCLCTEHVAITERVFRVTERGTAASTIRFLQDGAGRLADGPPDGAEMPYTPGQEYVAFLKWDRESGRLLRVAGPLFMFSVRDGRVHFGRTIAPGVPESLPIEGFERLLEKFRAARAR